MEVWKKVKGYDNYSISSYGNVRNDKTGKALKNRKGSGKYYLTSLTQDKKETTYNIHRLVAIAFLGHKPSGFKVVVDHIDGNPLNNNVNNLQLISQRENVIKGKRRGANKYVGVTWHKPTEKWISKASVNGKEKHIGLFTSEYEAHVARENFLKSV